MQRGAIWWASLPVPVGSSPGYSRPVVIIQADSFNRSQINTIIVAVITSNMRLATAPGNVPLAARVSGLPKESVVNVSQLLTIDKSLLTEKVGQLSVTKMQQIDRGLRLALSLD
ncbi:MAG: type II toxin-antitoxin system PemK/MazF family toxin [Ardenticatenaceae bacterium]|nr:type II toxin-antitoxin system PemK/MazF family toxin [Ardenticatenaceae bacterium]